MNKGIPDAADDQRKKRFYHGTRTALKSEDLIEPEAGDGDEMTIYVYLTPNLDVAIWESATWC